ncbi:MAG: dienelactone hydrolase family protein [Gammaproteobacteria bacterium]
MKTVLMFITLVFTSMNLHAEIIGKVINYTDGETSMNGYIAYDDSIKGQRPGILVVHEWWGHNQYARQRARMLAEQGYVALAVDMYGEGLQADHPKDAMKFSGQINSNFPIAESRFGAAMTVLKQQAMVDNEKLAAAGYCFGGGMVLQLARNGLDVDLVAVFHGSLNSNKPAQKGQIKAKVLVFNGEDDPMVKPEHIDTFKQEMNRANVDYLFFNYPGAKHAFTNPGADELGRKFNLPLAYNKKADRHSWAEFLQYLERAFK